MYKARRWRAAAGSPAEQATAPHQAAAPAPARSGDNSWGCGGTAAPDASAARAAEAGVPQANACCGPEPRLSPRSKTAQRGRRQSSADVLVLIN